ncbi:hypothetical protein BDZ89DRAFT_1043576 [Hymenopellis radicata]|nr:hypothetical protein BDZ89DRAFT_1043576 [Hymenopellis radicata]
MSCWRPSSSSSTGDNDIASKYSRHDANAFSQRSQNPNDPRAAHQLRHCVHYRQLVLSRSSSWAESLNAAFTGGVRPYQQVLCMTASHGSITGDPGMLLLGPGDAAERGALRVTGLIAGIRTRYPVNQAVPPYPHPAAPFPPSFCVAKTSVIDFSSFWYPFRGKIDIMVGISNQEILPPTLTSPPPASPSTGSSSVNY